MNPILIAVATIFTVLFMGFTFALVSTAVSDQDLEERLWRIGSTLVWVAISVGVLGVVVGMWWLAVAS